MSITTKISGLKELKINIGKVEKALLKAARKPIRKALTAGANDLKKSIRPQVPVLKSAASFRAKGTVKKNVRHKTKVAKDGLSGRTFIGIRRAGKKRMARVGENTRDNTDPFYWWMVNYGTKKMPGQHFMEKGANQGKDRALKTTAKTFIEEFGSAVKKVTK
ncbi:HK97-gp10 family putative phage morphogenesis protein [Testudinibacter sp. TR-2022]|uniref:HK97-gp10 family putative phage morphogenesis protein n=1 Tax=Testudinibacter sp. TR-2022 TaxID=2585029 RepID=UPI002278F1FF|nr:HK97-gp10 family putative phage morphogenesis protein [Testudinibacter sp. TR-2022]